TMEVLVEVNLAKEGSKGGALPEQLDELIDEIAGFEHLKLRGLMTIPPAGSGARYFEQAQKLLIDIQGKKLDNRNMSVLSMGMSSDYPEAIQFGSNIIRIGRGLFGERR
ncbi:MAG: YggS family pyridoxal phosphate-dependent enzyme, partial [Oscillospiraceae bacterium]|nr:YggS family pyridoxal phosphate-dependent enzyme [Oscillospiraceae bacterium]